MATQRAPRPRKAAAPAATAAPKNPLDALPKPPKPPKTDAMSAEDVAKLATNLVAAADRHGLCNTFYKEINQINEGLKTKLPVTKRGAVSTYSLRGTVIIPRGPAEQRSGGQHSIAIRDAVAKEIQDAIRPVLAKYGITITNVSLPGRY